MLMEWLRRAQERAGVGHVRTQDEIQPSSSKTPARDYHGAVERCHQPEEDHAGTEPYVYGSLDSSKHEIRLVTLHPGSNTDSIACSISHVGLGGGFKPFGPFTGHVIGEAKYETISYCWGTMSEFATISVDGKTLRIPSSAAEVLRKVRYRHRCRVLWIDSICINQEDYTERSQQVALTMAIYSQSTQTLIDLGDLMPDVAQKSLKSLHLLENEMTWIMTWDLFYNVREILIRDESLTNPNGKSLPKDVDFDALESLFTCAWFKRVWVLQEAALSKSTICLFGSCSVKLLVLLRACMWLNHKQSQVPSSLITTSGLSCGIQLWDYVESEYGYYRERIWRQEYSTFGGSDILHALQLANGSESTNAKDQVFGVLGLMRCTRGLSGYPEGLQPDYSKPLSLIYGDATRCALQEDGDLRVFINLHIRTEEEAQSNDWPSWVPRWNRRFDNEKDAVPFDVYTSFDPAPIKIHPENLRGWSKVQSLVLKKLRAERDELASNWKRGKWAFGMTAEKEYDYNPWLFEVPELAVNTRHLLPLPGFVADSIGECSSVLSRTGRVGHWWGWLHETFRMTETLPFSKEEQRQCLASTLVGGQNWQHRDFASLNDFLGLKSLYTYVKENRRYPPRLENLLQTEDEATRLAAYFYNESEAACDNRRFTVTRNGRTALVPQVAKEGDMVVVLHGGQSPFVLRPWVPNYKILGDCYVHGIMYGEAMQEQKKRNRADTIFTLC